MSEAGSARARLLAGPPETGWRVRRTDLEGAPVVPLALSSARRAEGGLACGEGGVVVAGVAPLVATLAALEVDDLEVELVGPELPALDGGAAGWWDLLEDALTAPQEPAARRTGPAVPIHLTAAEARYAVLPAEELRVSVGLRPPEGGGRRFASYEGRGPAFRRGLAEAPATSSGGDLELRGAALELLGVLALVDARLRAHVVAEDPAGESDLALARELRRAIDRERRGGRPALDVERILEAMPHRYPFLLVDRIEEFEPGRRLVGLKNVTINEPFFPGHFPGHPIMPGVLIVEAMAQAGGMLVMGEVERPEEKVVYFVSLDGVKFRRPVRPGDRLLMEMELLQMRGRTCRMRGVARVEGQVAAEATMTARVMDR